MKNSTIILIALFLSINSFAQTNMQIRKTDNSIISVPISEIDSVYYEAASSFTCGDPIADIDGNTYSTVEIGSQCWIGENLKVTTYSNGDAIPLVTDSPTWISLTTGAYCWYANDEATYKNTYGALYNWHTVSEGNVCPTGWHIPTHTEWIELTTYLGGVNAAGVKLKEAGTAHWTSPNTGANNVSGFTALPAGGRFSTGNFGNINDRGYFWTATEDNSSAWRRSLYYDLPEIYKVLNSKYYGLSVRCVRD